jgi:hypothetical protein
VIVSWLLQFTGETAGAIICKLKGVVVITLLFGVLQDINRFYVLRVEVSTVKCIKEPLIFVID